MLSVRVPNELWEAIESYAKTHQIILTASRANKRGQPNMSEATIALLRSGLGMTEESAALKPVVQTANKSIIKIDRTEEIEALKARLAAVEMQLQQQSSISIDLGSNSADPIVEIASASDLAFQTRVAGLFTRDSAN
jgi:ERCC4-related helicase